jgi:hypothetical protein
MDGQIYQLPSFDPFDSTHMCPRGAVFMVPRGFNRVSVSVTRRFGTGSKELTIDQFSW